MSRNPPAPGEAAFLAAVLLGGAAILLAAARIDPDSRGYGTHQQLGLPPCGFELATGLPCPTCGMTTSFAHFARLEPEAAFRIQPFGALLFVAVAASTLLALFHLVAWRSPAWILRRLPPFPILVAAFLLALIASWGWKILATGDPAS
jgi:hypothetical protein